MSNENRLRVVRAEKRVSQIALSRASDIHATRIWKIENGYVDPTADERRKIGRALNVRTSRVWPEP